MSILARKTFEFRIQGCHFEIPAYMREELVAYIEQGRPPGSFLYAVLSNDLKQAAIRADMLNILQLPAYAAYMNDCMPFDAQGSYQKVDAWIARFARERQLKENDYERP